MNSLLKKFLVVNADDFGLAPQTNSAIIESHRKGILTSTSLLATCPGFDHAVRVVRSVRRLGVGIHLSLTLGSPVTSKRTVPRLTRADGTFIPSFTYFLFRKDSAFLDQIESEFTAQLDKCLKAGIALHHIDSQSHVHMVPHIFRIVLKLAHRYSIPFIRFSRDRLYTTENLTETVRPYINTNIVKLSLLNSFSVFDAIFYSETPGFVRISDAYYGVTHTGNMNADVLHAIIDRLQPGVTEISLHPGYSQNDTDFDFDSQHMHAFMVSPYRKQEFMTLLDAGIVRHIRKNGIILCDFRKLSV